MIPDRLISFVAAQAGTWAVTSQLALCGDALPQATCITMVSAADAAPAPSEWALCGVTSNERYITAEERQHLRAVQQGLGRPGAWCAAMIPIRKNQDWWALAQDERREIFEAQSHHIHIGAKYLPPIARRLHHCRDLGLGEPFDFITWFEFAPEHTPFFNDMLSELRATPEWKFIDREVDIRMTLSNMTTGSALAS
jgi:chlorite dismutase